MVRGAYCGGRGAEPRVTPPLRVLARLPGLRAWPWSRCLTLRVRVPAWPSLSFVPPFACGFAALRGERIVGLPGSVGCALAPRCFCVPSSACLLSGLASFVSSLLWRCLCLFFPVSLQVTPCSFASFLLTNFSIFFWGKFPFSPCHKSFLQNNNTFTRTISGLWRA